jgi:nucleotide-binding universal stress UspA family protein
MTARRIVVPVDTSRESDCAVDLACRLAGARGARLVLVAPLVVECELPLDAHFPDELPRLEATLDRAEAIAHLYDVGVRRRVVRTRERGLGQAVAAVAGGCHAELVVMGSGRPVTAEVRSVVRDAPCPVLVATAPR